MHIRKIIPALFLPYVGGCLLCLSLAVADDSTAAERRVRVYTLAVVPAQLPVNIYRDWAPVLQRLSERLGVKIELKLYRTIPRFEAELAQGIPDFAFMNPYHQVMVRDAGYVPLVRSRRLLTGVLVVRKDSPVRSLNDLDGKLLAFPSPNAFGASLYMRALLTERANIRFNTYYVDAHNEVYRHVIRGDALAGGGVRASLDREPREVRERLRVIYRTPPTVGHSLSAHERVPARLRARVQRVIFDIAKNKAERKLLDAVQLTAPVKADYERDYAPLARLGLDKYVVMSH